MYQWLAWDAQSWWLYTETHHARKQNKKSVWKKTRRLNQPFLAAVWRNFDTDLIDALKSLLLPYAWWGKVQEAMHMIRRPWLSFATEELYFQWLNTNQTSLVIPDSVAGLEFKKAECNRIKSDNSLSRRISQNETVRKFRKIIEKCTTALSERRLRISPMKTNQSETFRTFRTFSHFRSDKVHLTFEWGHQVSKVKSSNVQSRVHRLRVPAF